jgi:hypothetical protein
MKCCRGVLGSLPEVKEQNTALVITQFKTNLFRVFNALPTDTYANCNVPLLRVLVNEVTEGTFTHSSLAYLLTFLFRTSSLIEECVESRRLDPGSMVSSGTRTRAARRTVSCTYSEAHSGSVYHMEFFS